MVAGKYNCCGLRDRIGLRGSGVPREIGKARRKTALIMKKELMKGNLVALSIPGVTWEILSSLGRKYTEQLHLTFALIDFPVVRIRFHIENSPSTDGLRLGVRMGGPRSLENIGNHFGYLVNVPKKAVPVRDYSQYEGNMLPSDTVRIDQYLDSSSGQLNRFRFLLFRDSYNHLLINKNPSVHKQEDPWLGSDNISAKKAIKHFR